MSEQISTGDITLLAAGSALLVIFFFSGTQKVYESIVGSLLGVTLFLLSDAYSRYITTFGNSGLFQEFLLRINESLQSFALTLSIILLIYSPMSAMIQMHSSQNSQLIRAIKTFLYTAFYLLYSLSVIGIVVYGPGPFAQDNFFSSLKNMAWWNTYIAQSNLFTFAMQNIFGILYLAIILIIAKLILGRIANKVLVWITIGILTARNIMVGILTRGRSNWKTSDEIIVRDEGGDSGED